MSLINISYFFNEFNVAQKSSPAVIEKLQYYIDNYEREYIEKALGKDFAALFNGSTEQRFADLEAMFIANPSPIAGYVFFHYQRDNVAMAVGAGDSVGAVENGNRISEGHRMAIAWNIMASRTREIRAFLIENKAIYPEFNVYWSETSLSRQVNTLGI